MANEVKLNLTIDKRKAEKSLDSVDKKASAITKNLKTGVASASIAFAALGATIGVAVAKAGEFEKITTQFKVLTGSLSVAKDLMRQISDFSAKTPFQFEELAASSAKLLAFGVNTGDVVNKLGVLGDVAAASGTNIQELTLIFGQVAAAGKLTGERLLQLQERAIPIGPALAKSLGVAESSIKDLVSKGKVDFATFEQAFSSLAKEGSFAFNGMNEQSKTLNGTISTLKDNITLLAVDLGNRFLPAIKAVTSGFISFAQGIRRYTKEDPLSKQLQKSNRELKVSQKEIDRLSASVERLRDAGQSESVIAFASGKLNVELKKREKLLAAHAVIAKQLNLDAVSKEEVQQKEAESTRIKKKELDTRTANELAAVARIKEIKATESEGDIERDATKLEQLRLQVQERQLIEDEARILELEKKGEHEKAKAELDKLELKRLQSDSQAKIRLTQAREQAIVNIVSASSNLIAALSSSGSKAAFYASKAAALAQAIVATNLAAAQALAVPPAPNVGLATLAKVAGGINIAAIAATTLKGPAKYAEGGMISGGTPGVDSVPILAQQGEVVIPVGSSFADIVNAGKAIGTDSGSAGSSAMEVIIGFKDNAIEIIEERILERRELGISAL